MLESSAPSQLSFQPGPADERAGPEALDDYRVSAGPTVPGKERDHVPRSAKNLVDLEAVYQKALHDSRNRLCGDR